MWKSVRQRQAASGIRSTLRSLATRSLRASSACEALSRSSRRRRSSSPPEDAALRSSSRARTLREQARRDQRRSEEIRGDQRRSEAIRGD